MTSACTRGLGLGDDAEVAHFLSATNVRMALSFALRAGARLHEHDLGAAVIAAKPLSHRMRHGQSPRCCARPLKAGTGHLAATTTPTGPSVDVQKLRAHSDDCLGAGGVVSALEHCAQDVLSGGMVSVSLASPDVLILDAKRSSHAVPVAGAQRAFSGTGATRRPRARTGRARENPRFRSVNSVSVRLPKPQPRNTASWRLLTLWSGHCA